MCFAVDLVFATKFSADVSEMLFTPIGVEGKLGFIISFLVIVLAIILTQGIIYRLLIKDAVDNLWNRIGGMLLALVEGALFISVGLILLSIYLKLPSDEAKKDSVLYKPIKNFAPMVYDSINTLMPESEDFYNVIYNQVAEQIKKAGEKLK
ncbi:MAG: CvpA family protein [Bacteroidetes bacterium]|nr:CvpA family protein [Bacteroidota bacterium]